MRFDPEDTREAFEKFVSSPPFDRCVSRVPDDPDTFAWPGSYHDINVDLAWNVWKESALQQRRNLKEVVLHGADSPPETHQYVEFRRAHTIVLRGEYFLLSGKWHEVTSAFVPSRDIIIAMRKEKK